MSSGSGGRNRNRNRRHRNRRSPSPVFMGFGDGPPREVPLTPFMVYMLELDDPFAEDEDVEEEEEEDDGHDSQDSDDEYNVMDPLEEINPGQAADILESVVYRYPRYRLRDLKVNFNHPSPDADERSILHYRAAFPVMFNQLVDGLEVYWRIKKLKLVHGNFWDPSDDDDEEDGVQGVRGGFAAADGNDENGDGTGGIDLRLQPDHDDLENLFGVVLCNHLSLDEITISKSRIQTKYWRLYTDNFPPPSEYSLTKLELQSVPLNAARCQLLYGMLHRKVALHTLFIHKCGLDEDEWRMLCEAIADNGRVHYVQIGERRATVRRDTLLPLLRSPTSNVGHLVVTAGSWADDDHAFEELVRELRTNTLLRDLVLYRLDSQPFPNQPLVEDLVTTYNFNLLNVMLMMPDAVAFKMRIDPILERNGRVRALFRKSPDGDDHCSRSRKQPDDEDDDASRKPKKVDPYRVTRRSAWNIVLPEYSRFPTLLYRFLRMSNSDDFISQIQQRYDLQWQQEEFMAQTPGPSIATKKSKKKKGKKKQQAKRRR